MSESLEALIEPLPTPAPRYLSITEDGGVVPFQGYGPVPPVRPRFPVWQYQEAVATERAAQLGITLSDLAVQPIAMEHPDGTIGWSTLADWNSSDEATAANDFTVALMKFDMQHDSGVITWDAERNIHIYRPEVIKPAD